MLVISPSQLPYICINVHNYRESLKPFSKPPPALALPGQGPVRLTFLQAENHCSRIYSDQSERLTDTSLVPTEFGDGLCPSPHPKQPGAKRSSLPKWGEKTPLFLFPHSSSTTNPSMHSPSIHSSPPHSSQLCQTPSKVQEPPSRLPKSNLFKRSVRYPYIHNG